MYHRSPARFLAPLALILATLAVYVVVQGEADTESTPSPSTTTAVTTTAKAKAKRPAGSSGSSKTYVVKSGDTLSAIAEKTGTSLETLLDLNDVDANSLTVGRRLKLRR